MKLKPQWIKHLPDFSSCITGPFLRAEADCPCGIKIRHRHCPGCGYVATKGDWDAKPIASYRIYLKSGRLKKRKG